MEKVVLPTVAFVGRLFPNLTVQGLGDPNYAYSLLKQYKGEWEFDTNWKMIFGHPKKAGWIKAIQEAQQTVPVSYTHLLLPPDRLSHQR